MLHSRDLSESDVEKIWDSLRSRIRGTAEKRASFAHRAGLPEQRLKDLSRADKRYRPTTAELEQVCGALGTSLDEALILNSGARDFIPEESGYFLLSYIGLTDHSAIPLEIEPVRWPELTPEILRSKVDYLKGEYDLSEVIQIVPSKAQPSEMALWAEYVRQNFSDPEHVADHGGINQIPWMNFERNEFSIMAREIESQEQAGVSE